MERQRTSGMAVASMVCGICGLVIPYGGFLLSIPCFYSWNTSSSMLW